MVEQFPIIPKGKLIKVVRDLKELCYVSQVQLFSKTTNHGRNALHMGLDFSLEGEYDFSGMEEEVDHVLGDIGFCFNSSDVTFGTSKCYIYKSQRGIWVAYGKNCYGFGQGKGKLLGGRILLEWGEKVQENI